VPTFKNPKRDPRALDQRGSEVNYNGNTNVDTQQNTTGQPSRVIAWTCPQNFDQIEWVGRRDPVRFRPRTLETITGTAGDDTVVGLNANIVPVAGEEAISEQPYPVVRAVNVASGNELDIDDVDYAANEVTLASDPADGEDVKLYPILAEGQLRVQGYDQFDHQVGVAERWETPLETWHSMDQRDPDTEVHLGGQVRWGPAEVLSLEIDAPYQIVWTDGDYPDAFVSEISFDVQVSV